MAVATCVATALERCRPLQVDQIIPDSLFTSTHAITIDAPPDRSGRQIDDRTGEHPDLPSVKIADHRNQSHGAGDTVCELRAHQDKPNGYATSQHSHRRFVVQFSTSERGSVQNRSASLANSQRSVMTSVDARRR
jgi:hypothetical protein